MAVANAGDMGVRVVSTEPKIQEIITPKGITVWLVGSPSIPMVSVEVAFRAGSAFEPADKQGLASLMASLLDEGAADKDDRTFKAAVERIGMRFGAGADKLDVTVSMDTLTREVDNAFALMGDAVVHPRFDAAPVARVKEATLAQIKRQRENPGSVAQLAFNDALFAGHVYGRSTLGEATSVATIEAVDLAAYHEREFNRANMVVSVVGDIKPAKLAALVDGALGDLPAGDGENMVASAPAPVTPQILKIERDVPQSTILLGHLGITRDNPDYFAVYVMNHIMGGGGFSSRLMEEVREKRGLAYGVSSHFTPMPYAGSFVAQVSTKNNDALKAMELIKAEMVKMQNAPVSESEYNDAVNYLTGSFPLRLDSNDKILGYLSAMQMEGMGADYLDKWRERVKAVTRADIQRVAKKYMHPDSMVVTIVGAGKAVE